jgi:adenylate cyclase
VGVRPRLIVRPGTLDEKTYDLKPGANTVGRTGENDLFIADRSLSRAHARIEVGSNGVVTIEDLESKNGTFVDGKRVDKQTLADSHTITFGEVPARYMLRPSQQPMRATAAPTPVPALTRNIATDIIRVPIADIVGATGLMSAAGKPKAQPEQRDRDKLRILLKVSQLLSSPASLDTVLGSVLDLAFEILDIDRGAILMVNPATGEIEPRVTRSRKGPASFSLSIARYVMEQSVAALFSDATLDPRLADAGSVLAQAIRTSMCAPLKPRDHTLGVLYVDNVTSANRFDADDLEFLSAFANQSAIAIENAMLGQKLAEEAVTRNTLLRFFPPAAVPAIVESGGGLKTMEAEATILFSDISGYTAMSERMKPTEIIALLNAYFPPVAEIVFRYEGTLEKYIGDALLAVWGVPVAHSDDSQRAVKAAIEMQRVVRAHNLKVHIGINSGPVAAGNIGSKEYIQYATIGDTTNVASRLCNVAGEGEIVIDERTAKRLPPGIEVDALGPTPIKGKKEPMNLFRVRLSV